jgi:hypothetical protein
VVKTGVGSAENMCGGAVEVVEIVRGGKHKIGGKRGVHGQNRISSHAGSISVGGWEKNLLGCTRDLQ